MEPGPGQTTLLVVDDDANNRQALAEIFGGDYRVLLAENGEAALKIAGSRNVHLILLDVQMPCLDGYRTCEILKQQPATADIPVIFLTGFHEPGQEVMGLELGAIDYVTKPFCLPVLKARVHNHMAQVLARRELEAASCIDGLTGLINRSELDRLLDQEWHAALRRSEPLSLILLDVDDFKAYNDCYGHLAGDECLKQVAAALTVCQKRPNDAVGRYGGEEFLAVLPNTSLEGASTVAESIRNSIASLALPHAGAGSNRQVSVSLGVACHSPLWRSGKTDRTLASVIDAADQSLYLAKKRGKNRVETASLG